MLASLIPEMLDGILGLLDADDFYSLRLTCRQLELRSRVAFGAASFSTLRVDFSRANLEWMTDISGHEDFRLSVREWLVSHWHGRGSAWKYSHEIALGDDGHWPRQGLGCLDPSSELVKQFVHLLSRFPNCTSAVVTDDRARVSYFPQNQGGPEQNLTSADAVELMLHAFSAPGAPPVQSFHTRICRDLDWFPPVAISSTSVASAQSRWAPHLRELVLEFTAEEDSNLANMLQLLTSASKLTTLRLKWYNRPPSSSPAGCLLGRHLDKFPAFAPPLAHLGLGYLSLLESDLLRLLSNCQDTLTTLDFYGMNLRSGSWESILEYLYTTPFPKLRRLSMFTCTDGIEIDFLAFCQLWKDRELAGSCGGTFEFGKSRTARGPPGTRQVHVTGFLFDAKEGASAMKSALRACVENCHRCPAGFDARPPCADISELRYMRPIVRYTGSSPEYERWTGLRSTIEDR